MKKHIPIILILLFGIVLFIASCNIIPDEDRIIPAGKIEMNKVVLLEDYTGQRCVNCPLATAEANLLKSIYNEHLIVVAVHAGGFALPALSTPEGEEYNSHFGITEYPTGLIDRKKVNNNVLQPVITNWGGAVKNNVWKKSGFEISWLLKEFHFQDSTLNIEIELTKDASLVGNGEYFLQLWLVESKIQAIQLMPDGSRDREYIHNHILREALNGTWGELIDFKSDRATAKVNNYRLRNISIPENAEIIAFIYDKKDYAILEALKTPLTN